jgi:hypothetical protein
LRNALSKSTARIGQLLHAAIARSNRKDANFATGGEGNQDHLARRIFCVVEIGRSLVLSD